MVILTFVSNNKMWNDRIISTSYVFSSLTVFIPNYYLIYNFS
jgi:hypothetical protein